MSATETALKILQANAGPQCVVSRASAACYISNGTEDAEALARKVVKANDNLIIKARMLAIQSEIALVDNGAALENLIEEYADMQNVLARDGDFLPEDEAEQERIVKTCAAQVAQYDGPRMPAQVEADALGICPDCGRVDMPAVCAPDDCPSKDDHRTLAQVAQDEECSCTELPDGRGTCCGTCKAVAAAEEMPY